MVLIFLAGIALPHAYGSDGALFAGAYAGVRFLHLGSMPTPRGGNAEVECDFRFRGDRRDRHGAADRRLDARADAQDGARAVAVAIDYAGPAWLTRERLRGRQRVAVAHFAERYGLFVIICLGESIAAIGVAATRQRIDGAVVGATIPGWQSPSGCGGATFTASPRPRTSAFAPRATPCSPDPTALATPPAADRRHRRLRRGRACLCRTFLDGAEHRRTPLPVLRRRALPGRAGCVSATAARLVAAGATALRRGARRRWRRTRWHARMARGTATAALLVALSPSTPRTLIRIPTAPTPA